MIEKSMKTKVHHAKLGNPPRTVTAEIIELTKAIIQASYTSVSTVDSMTRLTPEPLQLTTLIEIVARANGSPTMRPNEKLALFP